MTEVSFTPSIYSFDTEAEYHGWLANLWTREGRAENKLTRAKRKRDRGWTKGAERLERRAGILQAKAEGKRPTLHPKSPYDKLWASKFPWYERKRMTGSGLTGAARGYRPSRSQVRQEWRGTVLGGLTALKAAEDPDFIDIDVEKLPQKMIQSAMWDRKLVAAVSQATGKEFGDSLQKAAEEIRKVVIEKGLEEVAWPARALPMLGASAKRATITNAAASATSLGLSATATGIAMAGAAPPWIQNIATVPAAGILYAWSAIVGAFGSGAAVKASISKAKYGEYEQAFVANLQDWFFESQSAEIQEKVRRQRAKIAYQEEVAKKVGEARGQRMANSVTVIAWAGGISFALIATSAVVGHVRNQE